MLQDLLHLQSQARKAAPHIGMARRQPHPHARGDRNHRSAFNTADTSKGGADPQILIRPLPVNSTTITSPDGAASLIGSASNVLAKPATPGVNQTRRNIVIPRNLRHTRSRRKGLRNDPVPFILAPTPPAFRPRKHRNLTHQPLLSSLLNTCL
jgi:hypothetical protein